MIRRLSKNIRLFSTSEAKQTNFDKFESIYTEQLSKFKSVMETVDEGRVHKDYSNQKTFKHPYHCEESEIYFSPIKNVEYFHNFVGPEQISPHYESFSQSRKWLLRFLGIFGGISGISAISDFHWIMNGTFYPFVLLSTLYYLHLEGNKYFLKPVLTRWYKRIQQNEMFNHISYFKENQIINTQKNIDLAKNQIEYFDIHEEYNKIKADSINRFLATEEVNLKNHIHKRTINLLENVKELEKINKRNIINKILKETLEEYEKLISNMNSKEIQKNFFDLALKGILEGKMTYENDILLVKIKEFIKSKVEKISNLTPEEQKSLISLTEQQIANLKSNDDKLRDEYLQNKPILDAGLRKSEKVEQMLENWGK